MTNITQILCFQNTNIYEDILTIMQNIHNYFILMNIVPT